MGVSMDSSLGGTTESSMGVSPVEGEEEGTVHERLEWWRGEADVMVGVTVEGGGEETNSVRRLWPRGRTGLDVEMD